MCVKIMYILFKKVFFAEGFAVVFHEKSKKAIAFDDVC